GGIALGIAGGAAITRLAAPALRLGEAALDELVAPARQRLLDAPDVDDVGADAEDHADLAPPASARALSISARMRLIALSRPLQIASPTRKCPMFRSTMVWIAAIGPSVSNASPCPAWHSRPRVSASAAASRMRLSSRSTSGPVGARL